MTASDLFYRLISYHVAHGGQILNALANRHNNRDVQHVTVHGFQLVNAMILPVKKILLLAPSNRQLLKEGGEAFQQGDGIGWIVFLQNGHFYHPRVGELSASWKVMNLLGELLGSLGELKSPNSMVVQSNIATSSLFVYHCISVLWSFVCIPN